LQLLRVQLAGRRPERPLLLEMAERLEPLDAGLAREGYRETFEAALTAGRLGPAGGMRHVAEVVRAAPASRPPRATDLLLDGLAALVIDGPVVGAPLLSRAVRAFRDEPRPAADELRWLPFAGRLARAAWDDESWHALSARLIELARQTGALTALPDALQNGTALRVATGDTALAAAMAAEAATVATAWAAAVLSNGLSRYDEALAAAGQASADPDQLGLAEPAGDVLISGAPVGFDASARPVQAGRVRLFTGVRSDPFFADADGSFHGFQWTGQDAFADRNILSIALEVPNDMLSADPEIGVWGTVSVRRDGAIVQVDRGGHPTINPFVNPNNIKNEYNLRQPADDLANYLEL
jgi:uncharacterized protein DUF4331